MALFSLLVRKSYLCFCNLLAKLSLSPIYCKLHDEFCLPKRFMTALKQLKSNKELVVTKADKGNKVVIMNANDYKTKLNILLSDNDTYEPCVRDPLKFWQQNYNRSLKSIFADLSNLNKKKIQSYLSSLPYLYGLPKLHKNDIPLRPIVSTSGSVTYKLSKYIATILKAVKW